MSTLIISNNKKFTHYDILKRFGKQVDRLCIVSPFLGEIILKIPSDFPNVKIVHLFTNLDGYGLASANLRVIVKLFEVCFEKDIQLVVKHSNYLHGKVYLLYNKDNEQGLIITSGNYTNNGLINNYEYGVLIDDSEMQKVLYAEISSSDFSELSFEDAKYLSEKADVFEKQNPQTKTPVFKATDIINFKPSITPSSKCRYYIKPLGRDQTSITPGVNYLNVNKIGLPKNNTSISKGDIFICHGIGVSCILGYCSIVNNHATYESDFEGDRWNYKYEIECLSNNFSSQWWKYNLRTMDLVEEFNNTKAKGVHVTPSGGDSLGQLLFGSPLIEITPEFAHFIIDKLPNDNI